MTYDCVDGIEAQVGHMDQIRPADEEIRRDGRFVGEQGRGRYKLLCAISRRSIMPPEKPCSV